MDTMNSYSIISIKRSMSGVESRPGTCIGRYPQLCSYRRNGMESGDSLYNCLNNRLLLGLEWNYRYNLSKVQTYEEQKRALGTDKL